jgi:hypothetical protein
MSIPAKKDNGNKHNNNVRKSVVLTIYWDELAEAKSIAAHVPDVTPFAPENNLSIPSMAYSLACFNNEEIPANERHARIYPMRGASKLRTMQFLLNLVMKVKILAEYDPALTSFFAQYANIWLSKWQYKQLERELPFAQIVPVGFPSHFFIGSALLDDADSDRFQPKPKVTEPEKPAVEATGEQVASLAEKFHEKPVNKKGAKKAAATGKEHHAPAPTDDDAIADQQAAGVAANA